MIDGLKGFDISQHQSAFPDLTDMGFIILRASINTTKDTRFDSHYAKARALGRPTMAYHFNGPAGSAIEPQVELFLDVAKDCDFVWLDQELFRRKTDTLSEIKGFSDVEAQEFIDLVQKVRPCGLYHSASGFGGVRAAAKWVSDWRQGSLDAGFPRTTTSPIVEFPGWDIWQYNGSGDNRLDDNILNPKSALAKLFRIGYVSAAQHLKETGDLGAQIGARDATILQLNETNAALKAANDQLSAALDQAPEAERRRLAQVEFDRVMNS